MTNSITTVCLNLNTADLEACRLAAEEVPYVLHHAGQIFEYLGVSQSLGHFDENPQVMISLCELISRALKNIAENEGEMLAELACKLRDAKEVGHAEQ
ncbi:hypothetical protein [Profundibacter sp.]